MAFSIYSIFAASVLVLNALAILSETRLLAKFGLCPAANTQQRAVDADFTYPEDPFASSENQKSALKAQIAMLLSSVRTLLRWPLVFINTILVVLALILG